MRSSRSPYIHPDSTDKEEDDLIQAHPIPPEVYGRPYGGVPTWDGGLTSTCARSVHPGEPQGLLGSRFQHRIL